MNITQKGEYIIDKMQVNISKKSFEHCKISVKVVGLILANYLQIGWIIISTLVGLLSVMILRVDQVAFILLTYIYIWKHWNIRYMSYQ